MAWPGAGELRWQLREAHRMSVEGVEADDRAVRRRHHENPQVVRLGEFVGRALEKVVDRFNAAGEAFPVVALRVEGLDGRFGRVRGTHFEMTVRPCRSKASRSFAVGSGGLSRAAKKAAWSTGFSIVCSCAAIVSSAER